MPEIPGTTYITYDTLPNTRSPINAADVWRLFFQRFPPGSPLLGDNVPPSPHMLSGKLFAASFGRALCILLLTVEGFFKQLQL
jgi:hypothetical protein